MRNDEIVNQLRQVRPQHAGRGHAHGCPLNGQDLVAFRQACQLLPALLHFAASNDIIAKSFHAIRFGSPRRKARTVESRFRANAQPFPLYMRSGRKALKEF